MIGIQDERHMCPQATQDDARKTEFHVNSLWFVPLSLKNQ